jgi:hypothetical protein
MEELSLTLLDIVQNSVAACATTIVITIWESPRDNIFRFRVADNGQGMDETLRAKVTDPFFTTRTTRRVGLGLPLLDMLTKQCDGTLTIRSQLRQGTVVEAFFPYNHIDRPPFGNVKNTLLTLLVGNPDISLNYIHHVDDRTFTMHSSEITSILGDIPFSHPMVYEWLNNFIEQGLKQVYGGAHK